jgi:hypothetical protein
MRKIFPALLGAALVSLATISPAHAAIVLDQDAFVPDPSGPPLAGRIVTTIGGLPPTPNNIFAGQTVTAGLAGRLSAIELQDFRGAPNTIFGFTLFDGDLSAGGRPIGFINGLVPTAGGLPTALLDVSDFDYNVTPGQIFSFSIGLLSGPPNASSRLLIGNFAGAVPPGAPPIQNFNDYVRGVRFRSVNGSPFIAQLSGDLGFRTFVDTGVSGVPEPQSWAMMIFGFAAVGGAMRRRRERREMMA